MPGVLILCLAAVTPLLLALWMGRHWAQLPDHASLQRRHIDAGTWPDQLPSTDGGESIGSNSRQLLALVMVAPVAGATWLLLRAVPIGLAGLEREVLMALLSGLLALGFLFLTRRLAVSQGGVDCDHAAQMAALAVARSLAPLSEQGWDVLHAVPARGFVIDHLVIGPSALFAIDTRLLAPPSDPNGEPPRVQFDGERLQFPDHLETRAPDQARARALWLAGQLGAQLGEPVRVVPVLALPGWRIDNVGRVSRPDLLVRNSDPASSAEWPDYGPPFSSDVRRRVLDIVRRGLPSVGAAHHPQAVRSVVPVAA